MTAPSNANTSGLEPCPFCGGKAEIEQFGNTRVSTIYSCDDCGCRLETGEEFNHGRAWNRRVTAASAQARIAELEAKIDVHRQTIADDTVRIIKLGKKADRATAAEARADRLARFGQHINWELSFCYLDDEEGEPGCWAVHSVNGGRNDREWTLIGRGDTPDDAIRAALQQEG